MTKLPLDRRGALIRPGCHVIWLDNRGYSSSGLYRTLDVRKRVMLLLAHDGDEQFTTWVNPESVIVVDSVPYVEGTTNTKQKEKEND